ncbi:MAG: GxxExxY protein [Ignavibacteriaceae bacterium]|jgi:GxxExxY protein
MTRTIIDDAKILYKEESYKIIGACMNVHKKLGHGFLESVYSEALEMEFINQKIPYKKEIKLSVYYDGQLLKKFFKADFVCFDSIILELKSANFITEADRKQAINYLKATKFKLALLVNFGTLSLTYKRIINSCNSS